MRAPSIFLVLYLFEFQPIFIIFILKKQKKSLPAVRYAAYKIVAPCTLMHKKTVNLAP